MSVGNSSTKIYDEFKNLGLLLDSSFRFNSHISNCIRRAYANLKLLYNNKDYLSRKYKVILSEALVLSQFNYCDILYDPCLYSEEARRIQVVQNACICYIFGISKYSHVSHKLNELGWFNMSMRRLHHSAVFYFKLMLTRSPKYPTKKISYRTDIHNINIRRRHILTIPRHKTELFKRSFSYRLPYVMNKVPESVRTSNSVHTFKREYKMLLLNDL